MSELKPSMQSERDTPLLVYHGRELSDETKAALLNAHDFGWCVTVNTKSYELLSEYEMLEYRRDGCLYGLKSDAWELARGYRQAFPRPEYEPTFRREWDGSVVDPPIVDEKKALRSISVLEWAALVVVGVLLWWVTK